MTNPLPPLAAPQIDAVVREVVRRLEQAGVLGTPVSGRDPQPVEPTPRELTVPERLVTLSTITDWLTGIERVVVRPDAVVTPAVRDELRGRGIKLSRGQGSRAETPAAGQLLLAAAETDACPHGVARQLGSIVRVLSNRDQEPVPALLPKLLAEMSKHSARGVLLTDHPEAALCLANAQPGITAAEGRQGPRLAKVLARLSPNLLLLDGHERSPYEIRQLIQQFQAYEK